MAADPADPLIITTRPDADGVVIDVSGELDLLTAPQLRAAVAEALAPAPPPAVLTLDLTAVAFCDSTGISALVATRNAATERATKLHITASDQVARVLDIVGLTALLAHDDTKGGGR